MAAVFSLALLTSWHEAHPDGHAGPALSSAVESGHHDHDAGDDLDHIAAHAALHGVGLPAQAAVTLTAVPLPERLWQAPSLVEIGSTELLPIRRPPKA